MGYIGTPIDTRNQFQSLQGKRFNGDGSTTDFTLDVAPSSTLDIEVFVGNVRQDPNSAYTVSGTTLSFTGAPPSGTNNVYVVHQAKSVGTIDVPALGVSTASLQANSVTGAKLNTDVISAQTALAETPADTDELLISDAGTIKRIDFSHIKSLVGGTRFMARKTSSNQTINRATATLCTFNTEDIDTASGFSSNRFTFTSDTAGTYVIFTQIKVDSSNTNDVLGAVVEVRKNGAASDAGSTFVFDHLGAGYISGTERPTQDVQVGGAYIQTFAASDYIEVFVTQKTGTVSDSAGRINAGDGHNTYFGGFRLA